MEGQSQSASNFLRKQYFRCTSLGGLCNHIPTHAYTTPTLCLFYRDVEKCAPFQGFILSVDYTNPDFENNKGLVAEDMVPNPEVPVGQGYSESKWVAERILDTAAERTPLRPAVVRLGQVCGERNGTWNEKEWFPSIVKSALALNCLPNLDGVSGIPIKNGKHRRLSESLDRLLDHSTGCSRGNARDIARRYHPRRTHLPRRSPPWHILQHPHQFGCILARSSTLSFPRMVREALRGTRGSARLKKASSRQSRVAPIRLLRLCTHRTRVGTYRHCAPRYIARGARVKSAG